MEEILRECTRCGLQAFTKEQRQSLFVRDNASSKERFGFTKARCKKCNAETKGQGRKYGPNLLRQCSQCKTFPISIEDMQKRFVKDKSVKIGYANLCLECNASRGQKYYKNNKTEIRYKNRAYVIKKKYGITLNEYEKILIKQNYSCAICKKHIENFSKNLHVDHDHKCCSENSACSKCIRGLLCYSCNSLLGFAKDDTIILENAIKYLRRD